MVSHAYARTHRSGPRSAARRGMGIHQLPGHWFSPVRQRLRRPRLMRVQYVSPSTLPSRAANSVHVPLQCEGLVRAGAEVTLYAKRSVKSESELMSALRESYGIDPAGIRVVSYYSSSERAVNVRIAALA